MFLDAAASTTNTGSSLGNILTLLMIPLLLVIMYFVMIRPQRKQEKEAANMRNSLSVGDEITTIGGIIGRVVNVKEDTFVLETTKERTRIRFERTAIKRIDRKFDAPVTEDKPAEIADGDGTAEEKKAEEENK
ncbi:MAG: preprotein translocase subunit YajC [Clostridiales bacterium]|nr:preprotein translocase subunit YajC [Clostridiales bacterium]